MPASGTKEHMSDAELEQRGKANRRHGAYSYRDRGDLPARLGENFDRELAKELLEHAGGDPAFQLLAQSAARRATMIELAYSWLGAEDVKVMWAENEDGHKIVKMQPILKRISSWHEGLRRDLAELGLTPQSRAKLGLPEDSSVLEAALKAADDHGGDDES
jgi:hypothetical protein